jgi:nicotinamide phosphoribosyltransferase
MPVQHHTDFYKVDHRSQYPENTQMVFSNWTPRGSRIEGINEVVFFGLQYYMLRYLQDEWQRDFLISLLRR